MTKSAEAQEHSGVKKSRFCEKLERTWKRLRRHLEVSAAGRARRQHRQSRQDRAARTAQGPDRETNKKYRSKGVQKSFF